jgi:phospholipid/cholesterol/gamma-HCH transport system substrate-binding protein
METGYTTAEKCVGLFALGITLLLLTTVVMLGRGKDWFSEEVTFNTSFKESYNLQVNAAVKLFKADIGKVTRISLGKDDVNVQLAILAKYASRIRQDSVAVVDSPTLIGSEYISIIPGAADSPTIPPGGEIPSIERKSISDVLKEFQVEKTAMLAVRAIQQVADLIAMVKDPHGPVLTTLSNIEKTTASLARITARIDKGQGTLGSLVASREAVDSVLASLEKVDGVLDDIRATSAKGPAIAQQVSDNLTTIQTVGTGVAQDVKTLQSILNDARASLHTIRNILANLKQGSRDIPQVTATAKDGIREIREGVANIDRVVQSLQRNVIIRSNLPPEPTPVGTDVGIRP